MCTLRDVRAQLKAVQEELCTQGLIDISAKIMRRQDVTVTELRAVVTSGRPSSTT